MNPATTPAILCEQCGYPIDVPELAADGRLPDGAVAATPAASCPECGYGTVQSLPRSRPGSPWQQRPGVRSWFATSWLAIRHPIRLFRSVRIERRGARSLLWINLVLAATAIVAPWSGALIGDPLRSVRGQGLVKQIGVAALAIPIEVGAIALVFFALTWIESFGIRFIAARRGWRLLPDAARQICAHASVGWVACGVLPFLVLFAFEFTLRVFGVAPGGTIDGGPVIGAIDVRSLAIGGSVLAGYILGMLIFETLVFVGVRRCKFSNQFVPRERGDPEIRDAPPALPEG